MKINNFRIETIPLRIRAKFPFPIFILQLRLLLYNTNFVKEIVVLVVSCVYFGSLQIGNKHNTLVITLFRSRTFALSCAKFILKFIIRILNAARDEHYTYLFVYTINSYIEIDGNNHKPECVQFVHEKRQTNMIKTTMSTSMMFIQEKYIFTVARVWKKSKQLTFTHVT